MMTNPHDKWMDTKFRAYSSLACPNFLVNVVRLTNVYGTCSRDRSPIMQLDTAIARDVDTSLCAKRAANVRLSGRQWLFQSAILPSTVLD